MKQINFDPDKLAEFKKALSGAIAEKKEVFVFEEHEFLVSYARYLVEYLDTKVPSKVK